MRLMPSSEVGRSAQIGLISASKGFMPQQIATIIPTYRRPRLLARAIRSVLCQSYPDFEVHVYDNASGDETPEVVAQFAARDPRVKYHAHPRNIGMMENFAFGISHVETPYFSILSDDDFLLPGFFERAMSDLEDYPEAMFFFGGQLYTNSQGEVVAAPVEVWNAEGLLRPPALFEIIAPGAWVTWTSILFRSSVLSIIGGLDTALGHTADVDLILRAALRCAALLSKTPCAAFTIHSGSASESDRSHVHEAHLELTGFTKMERAIHSAGEDGIFSRGIAARLGAIYRARVERNLFRRALLLALHGESVLALKTADVLGQKFDRTGLAALIRFAADQGAVARLPLLALRGFRAARRVCLDAGNAPRHRQHTALIEESLSKLSPGDVVPVRRSAQSRR